jgi:predicted HTH domain antitoxin
MGIELFCLKEFLLNLIVNLGEEHLIILRLSVSLSKVFLESFDGELRNEMSLPTMTVGNSEKVAAFKLVAIDEVAILIGLVGIGNERSLSGPKGKLDFLQCFSLGLALCLLFFLFNLFELAQRLCLGCLITVV